LEFLAKKGAELKTPAPVEVVVKEPKKRKKDLLTSPVASGGNLSQYLLK
jgi:hypothetical protein